MRFLITITFALFIAAAASKLVADSLGKLTNRLAVIECSTDTDCCLKNPSICE